MKKSLINLNGWQRFFIFIIVFVYLPVTIVAIYEMEKTYVRQASNEQLNKNISDYLQKEKSLLNVFIETDYDELAKKYGGTRVNEQTENETGTKSSAKESSQDIKVKFNSENEFFYIATFKYAKEPILFNDDVEVKKLAEYLQKLFDKNNVKVINKFELFKIFLIFLFASAFTYFIGFMVGWVIQGFKNSGVKNV